MHILCPRIIIKFWKMIGCQWRERERERERDGIEKNQYKVIKSG